MADNSYEAECMRAELLGIPAPDYDDFISKRQKEIAEASEEEIQLEHLKAADIETEQLGRVTGGLEDLSSILQVTQRRISRFKASCGSLTNLLKFKIQGHAPGEAPDEAPPSPARSSNGECSRTEENRGCGDLTRALDHHVDKLDGMIEKAEQLQLSMAQQNKQMKRFLN